MSDIEKPINDEGNPVGAESAPEKNEGEPQAGGGSSAVEGMHGPVCKCKTAERERTPRRWWEIVLVLLPIVISLAALVVGFGSRDAARKSAKAAKRSSHAVERSAAAAEQNVDTAKKALDTAIDRDRRDQRAWVTLEGVDQITPLAPQVAMISKVNIKNSGRSPALDVSVLASTAFLNGPPVGMEHCDPPDEKNGGPESVGVIGPEVTGHIGARLLPKPQEFVAAVKSHQITVYVCGKIRYSDIFRGRHLTEYCAFYQPDDGSFGACKKGNTAN